MTGTERGQKMSSKLCQLGNFEESGYWLSLAQ